MIQPAFKVDIIGRAYSKLRISGLTVDPSPEDLELALCELEAMMAEYASRNMEVGYLFTDDPDPNDDLGVPLQFWPALSTNLAVRLIPDFNKQVPDTLLAQASQSLSNMAGRCAADKIRGVQYPSRQPIGSGNQLYGRWTRFYNYFNALPPNAPGVQTIMQGETNDFRESFEAYLHTGEAITSHEVVCDTGLVVDSSANADPIIDYRLTAPIDQSTAIWQLVKITITTDIGRVDIRIINFQVAPRVVVGDQP